MKLLRYKENPLLKPDKRNQWETGAVFNCGATLTKDGNIALLYRAIPAGYKNSSNKIEYTKYISSIGYAVSKDGYNFIKYDKPVISPSEDWDLLGCEDPRITRFIQDGEEVYLITYTALSNPHISDSDYSNKKIRVALASTYDFINFKKHGVIIPGLEDKDAVIFPEEIKGKIVMFHRIVPNIQVVYFNSIDELMHPSKSFWLKYKSSLEKYTVMKRKYSWESKKIGSGPPPIKTKEGWILFYHGVDEKKIYRVGVALLELEEPSRVIARSSYPILEPETEYEKYGDVNNVVFPEGAVVLDETIFIYYGAGDKYCCLATVKIQDILDFLKDFKT